MTYIAAAVAVMILSVWISYIRIKSIRKQLAETVAELNRVRDHGESVGADHPDHDDIHRIYRRMVDFSKEGIYRYRWSDGVMLFANPAIVEILDLECTPEELVGKRMNHIIQYTENVGTIRQRLEKYGEIHGYEYHFKTLKGDDRWVIHNSFKAIDARTGEQVVEAMVTDITDWKRMEQLIRQDRERLRVTLHSIGDGVIAVDTAGLIQEMNERAETMTGWFRSEAIGKFVQDVYRTIDEETDQDVDNPLETILQSDNTFIHTNKKLVTTQGTVRNISENAALLKEQNGLILGVVFVFRDITQEKHDQEMLRLNELRVQSMLELYQLSRSSQQEIIMLALEKAEKLTKSQCGYIAFIDGSSQQLYQVHFSENTKRICRMDLSVESCNKAPFINEIVRTKQPLVVNQMLDQPDHEGPGEHPSLSRHINVPVIEDDHVLVIAGVANKTEEYTELDIRQLTLLIQGMWAILVQKKAKDERDHLFKEYQRSNRDLEDFAYSVSHDLQAPLRNVASFSQLLVRRYETSMNPDTMEYITYITSGVSRMQQMIRALLEYSRVGTRGKAFAWVDSEEVLRDVLLSLRFTIEESQTETTRDPLPMIWADRNQLSRVFLNLIQNAIKFRSQETPRIHIAAVQEGNEWIFSVKDNGIGIPENEKELIFIVFRRLHTEMEYPGTGIGLALVKKIIARHQGRVWVDSQEGHGATFYFTIPIRKENHE